MWFSHPGADEPASRLIGGKIRLIRVKLWANSAHGAVSTALKRPWKFPPNPKRGSRILFQASIFSGSYIDYIVNFLGCIYVSTNQLQPIGSLLCGADLVPQKFSRNNFHKKTVIGWMWCGLGLKDDLDYVFWLNFGKRTPIWQKPPTTIPHHLPPFPKWPQHVMSNPFLFQFPKILVAINGSKSAYTAA